MRHDIKEAAPEAETDLVYRYHDQFEAITMADSDRGE